MSQIVISYHAGVAAHSTLSLLNRFVDASLAQGHEIKCIFLYQSGVYQANPHIMLSNDELQVSEVWNKFKSLGIELMMCVTAAEKRGVDTEHVEHFKVAGLAEFAMLTAKADKWVQFK